MRRISEIAARISLCSRWPRRFRCGVERRPARVTSAQKPCGTITVAAASDLTDAMNEIAANFEKATGCAVRVSTGSSGNFLSQIENGAPFDVFFSADIEYPKKLEARRACRAGKHISLCRRENRIVGEK